MPPLSVHTFTLRKALWAILIVILVSFVLIYIGYQSQSFITGPTITLNGTYTPKQTEKSILVEGSTANIVELMINGKVVHTNEEGNFSHTLILEDGYSIATFSAKDRFGRTTSIERDYVYVPLPQ